MLAAGKQAQHARGIGDIGWLAKKLAINDNYCVGSEHAIVRTLTRNRQRLLARQAFSSVFRGFSKQRIFRDVRGLHLECNSCVAQQFLSTQGGRGEH